MSHPYRDLPAKAFWRNGILPDADGLVADLYAPKFSITADTGIATAGSCFAQHIGDALHHADCNLIMSEPPLRRMPASVARAYGYGIYGARYGNIYTPRQLLELLQEVQAPVPDPRLVWERDGRYYDALRPAVEPGGLGNVQDVLDHRRFHLMRVSQLLEQADIFIFTLGLTEAWIDLPTGRVLPVCPGVIAGEFDPARHELHQFSYPEIMDDLARILDILQQFQTGMKLLLTVSPVPLTATATDDHVLIATTEAKANLRAAAGALVRGNPDADYFPAYEIVTSSVAGGPWFAEDWRNVAPEGVARVMQTFFAAHWRRMKEAEPQDDAPDDDPFCEEALLQVFAP
jgi:hypothetical protein